MRLVVLDNEAVTALKDPHHPHHRKVLQYVEANRATRRSNPNRRTLVPTTVRVEAGWDRTRDAAAGMNRMSIGDIDLNGSMGNVAARIRDMHGVSVADAHIGAVIQGAGPDDVTVITSDPSDMHTVADTHPVTVITL